MNRTVLGLLGALTFSLGLGSPLGCTRSDSELERAPAEPGAAPKEEGTGTAEPSTVPTGPEVLHLKFGLYTSRNPATLRERFAPVLRYLEQELAKATRQTVRIDPDISGTYEEGQRRLLSGEVHFGQYGPSTYVEARTQNPQVTLIAEELEGDNYTFRGVIASGKGITKLEDLKGKTFAFVDPTSTTGGQLAKAVLAEAGIRCDGFAKMEYLGKGYVDKEGKTRKGHEAVAQALVDGLFEAGALNENTLRDFEALYPGKLNRIHAFMSPTRPWVASASLKPELVEHIREAMVLLKDQKIIKSIQDSLSGFRAGYDQDYDDIRKRLPLTKDFDAPCETKEKAPGSD
ncbi:MAG: PhnD/SsuA/transferrin family substrate-binding protein [Planctomycetes bacterium]|nr:PhnD/SsuA/transferrin family substrate-binding protein [Planctomycetota bacterium]